MFIDSELRFSGASGDSPTATGDNISGTIWDSGPLGLPTGSGGGSGTNAGRDLGVGDEMWLEILVTVAVTSTGSATVTFALASDSSASLANVALATAVGIMVATAAIPKATLIKGFLIRQQLPAVAPGITNPWKRYVGVDYNIATQTLSAGTFDTKLVKNIQEADQLNSGFTVS